MAYCGEESLPRVKTIDMPGSHAYIEDVKNVKYRIFNYSTQEDGYVLSSRY